jgi:hypothetical protein
VDNNSFDASSSHNSTLRGFTYSDEDEVVVVVVDDEDEKNAARITKEQ